MSPKIALLAACLIPAWPHVALSMEEERSHLAPDPRLEQKATLTAVAAPLSDVLAELSQRTGVSLDLHLNLKNQKVTVLVDDQPLYVVMNQLRDLLDALWFTEDVKGKTGYYLQQKAGWQFEMARFRAARKAEEERKEPEFRNHVSEVARIASLPQDQLLAMLETYPQSVVDSLRYGWPPGEPFGTDRPDVYGTAALLGHLSDRQLSLVFGGARLLVPYNDLPESSRAIVDRVTAVLAERGDHPLSGVDPSLLTLSVSRGSMSDAPGKPEWVQVSLFKEGGVGLVLACVGPPHDPGPDWPTGMANMLGVSEGELRRRLEATEAGGAMLRVPGSPKLSPRVAGAQQSSDPARSEEGVLNLDFGDDPGPGFETVLKAMRAKTAVQLVADSYVVLKGTQSQEARVPKAPDKMVGLVAATFGRTWVRDGYVYRLRSNTWPTDESLEPPVWLIKRMQGKVGTVAGSWASDLREYVTMVNCLSDEQIEAVVAADITPYYYGVIRMAGECRGVRAAVLRLYASLDAIQQQHLRSEGIGMAQLNPGQRVAFGDCLSRIFKTEVPPPQAAAATMHLVSDVKEREQQSGEKWIYKDAVFVFTLAGGKEEKISFSLASMPSTSVARKPE